MMQSVAKYAELSPDGKSLTVHLPLTLRRRGGRKIIISPAGAQQWTPARPRKDNTLIRGWRGRSGGNTCWKQASSPQ
ncbi:hypothetical protein [Mesorhizobium temperatum]|uniref:hypothetical protein n=1 Tax=Mesorhizobium temperatum TaxID=241416 RepID=UPI001FD9547F|nr:hypothetical protein [Mesorhizobium temperatum]